MSASYITHDGSRTYRSINNPDWRFPRLHYISGVDFCRKAPDIGYAGTESNGLFKTTDRGKSWQRLSTASIERIFDWKFARIPISTVTVDPSNPDCVWAGTGYLRRVENRGKRRLAQGLLHSSDGGKNWTLLPNALPRGEMATADSDVRAAPRSDSCCNGRWNLCKQGRRKNIFRNDERAPGRHDLFRHRRHD